VYEFTDSRADVLANCFDREVDGCLHSVARVVVMIPEIVDHEVRRELVRVGATAGLRRLDALLSGIKLLPLERPALLRATELRAKIRNAGLPTADPHALDADAILAGQALTAASPGDVVVVAPANVSHIARFHGIDAWRWTTIT
jgi:predicted nucleic acid-binding protein